MPNSPHSPSRGRWQYGIGALLLLMIPFSILTGALAGMLNPTAGGAGLPRAFFVVLAIVVPMGLMMALGLLLMLRKWFFARRRKHLSPSSEETGDEA